ncbi:hypothetical protein ZWY2020_018672 [Hordeum vulgare]|nr:hypothetical protein ZWY2020_018672 [Hordeum vulgare]
MVAAGGGEEQVSVRRHGEQASASSAGVEVKDSPRAGETGASSGAGHSAAQLIGALRRSQEEVATMGKADVLAYEDRLRALRLRVLQRIQEEEEAKGAAADQQPTTEPRRVG